MQNLVYILSVGDASLDDERVVYRGALEALKQQSLGHSAGRGSRRLWNLGGDWSERRKLSLIPETHLVVSTLPLRRIGQSEADGRVRKGGAV